jgi:hypothetical protein
MNDRAPAIHPSMGVGVWWWYCSDCKGIPLRSDRDEAWYVRVMVDGERLCLCVRCWRARGRPWEPWPSEPGELEEHEAATRQRMLMREGTDAYLVRSGRT